MCSYTEHIHRYGRSTTICVLDDSDLSNAAINKNMLSGYSGRLWVRHASHTEKELYAKELVRNGIEPEIARFGLLGDVGFPICTTGANRNAFLLDTVGETVLALDDDVLCRFARHPTPRTGLALVGHEPVRDMWFYKAREDIEAETTWIECDFLAEHEHLLGKPIGAILAEHRDEGVVFNRSCNHLMEGVSRDDGIVLASMSGLVGDSGANLAVNFLMSERAGQWGLAQEPCFETALRSREVLWVAPQPTISHGSPCQATALGLFNRTLIPPFNPIGRNQDGVFGDLLGLAAPAGFLAHVPVAVYHAATPGRQYARDPDWRLSDLLLSVMALVWRQPRNVHGTLREMGSSLEEISHLRKDDFWYLVFTAQMKAETQRCDLLHRVIKALPVSLPAWESIIERYRETVKRRLLDQDGSIPVELRQSLSVQEAKHMTKPLIGLMGRFLQTWPAMLDAAAALKRKGIRITRAV